APANPDGVMEEGYSLLGNGEPDLADLQFQAAIDIYHEMGGQEKEAYTLVNIGWAYRDETFPTYNREYLERALAYLQNGLEIFQELDHMEGEAEALHDIALVYEGLVEYEKAYDHFSQAQKIWRNLGNREQNAWALAAMGWNRSKLFDYEAAMALMEQSLEIFREIGDYYGEAVTLEDIGLMSLEVIGFRQAIDYQLQALAIYQAAGDIAGEANAQNSTGMYYIVLAEYDEALRYLGKARELWEGLGDRLNESRAINNTGVVYSYLGEAEKALSLFEQSLEIAREIDDPWREAIWLTNIGESYLDLGNPDLALTYLFQGKALFEEIGEPRQVYTAANLETIGMAYLALAEYEQAEQYLQQALTIMQGQNDLYREAYVLNSLGELYFQISEYEQALGYLVQALEIQQKINDKSGEASSLELIGKIYEALGDKNKALENYLEAITVNESILGGLKVESFQTAFAGKEAGVYQRTVRLLVEMERFDEAFYLSESNRARAFLDSMGNKRPDLGEGTDAALLQNEGLLRDEISVLESALLNEKSKSPEQQSDQVIQSIETQMVSKQQEYEDLLSMIQLANPELASLISISPSTREDILSFLDTQTTLVSYYLTDTNVLAFILNQDAFHVVELPATPDEIIQAVESFMQLGLANLNKPQPRSLTDLYEWLIDPILPDLTTPKVAIIPYQVLHHVPFAALTAGEKYFGEQFLLFQIPTASALPFILAKSGREISNPLVLGDPDTDNPDLPSLDYAVLEAQYVAELFDTQPLLKNAATEAALQENVSGSGVVHLAVHGGLNPVAPLFSRLWLAPGDGEDGHLNIHEVYSLDLDATELVVLSACQTQLGQLSAGDEIVSLNRAF
ncbi:MAG: CHAT domain-containing protein, partial [Anaerolineaceae bacterium]|nr:CHAT domain-containing protein [Anaerolineaceae bacterium]